MKNINKYINERLHITTKSFVYSCQPETKEELQEIIIERINKKGSGCDLNDIDVSNITDMSDLFNANTNYNLGNEIFKDFNGDISMWNVSNVINMNHMFNQCEQFNCDISDWDVSNVKDTECMFHGCKIFNCDLSRWNVKNVKNMYGMFDRCEKFNGDKLDMWDVSNVKDMDNAFLNCPTTPKWYDKDKCE